MPQARSGACGARAQEAQCLNLCLKQSLWLGLKWGSCLHVARDSRSATVPHVPWLRLKWGPEVLSLSLPADQLRLHRTLVPHVLLSVGVGLFLFYIFTMPQ